MKKLICLLLALTLCVGVACPVAFAAEDDFQSSPGTEPTECEHPSTTLVGQKDPTCTEEGYTGDHVCDECGEIIEEGEPIPKLPHDYKDGKCVHCGASETPPQTGDNSHLYLWMAMMAAAAFGLVALFVVYRKKQVNQ